MGDRMDSARSSVSIAARPKVDETAVWANRIQCGTIQNGMAEMDKHDPPASDATESEGQARQGDTQTKEGFLKGTEGLFTALRDLVIVFLISNIGGAVASAAQIVLAPASSSQPATPNMPGWLLVAIGFSTILGFTVVGILHRAGKPTLYSRSAAGHWKPVFQVAFLFYMLSRVIAIALGVTGNAGIAGLWILVYATIGGGLALVFRPRRPTQ